MRRAFLRFSLIGLAVAPLAVASLGGCKAPVQMFKQRPKSYHTIVSLSPSTTEILFNADELTQLAGRTSADDWPPGQVKNVPIVATTKPDYEKIIQIHPDLIVYDADLFNDQDVAKMKELGADMFSYDANSWADFRIQLFKLASLLGDETHVSDYVDRVTIELNQAAGKLPKVSPKVAIVLGDPSGNDMIDGTESFDADIVRRCGGTPVGPKGTRFVKLSPEELVAENPDIIITAGTQNETTHVVDVAGAEALLKDPRFQTVAAIKNRKVTAIESEVLERRGSRVDKLVDGIDRAVTG